MPLERRVSAPFVVAALAGIAVGIGGYAFAYARGTSYLGNDPATCANCHVMGSHYDGWRRASHHAAATCNDCHIPEGPAKLPTKAENGYHHSAAFTLGGYPDVLRARASTRAVIEGQCRRCHGALVHALSVTGDDREVSCIRCHESVGHLR